MACVLHPMVALSLLMVGWDSIPPVQAAQPGRKEAGDVEGSILLKTTGSKEVRLSVVKLGSEFLHI